MKVLLISDRTDGGAGIACRRLYQGLREGVEQGASGKNQGDTPPVDVRWLAMSGEQGVGADLAPDESALDRKLVRRLAFRFAPDDESIPNWIHRWQTWGLENSLLQYIRKYTPDVISLHNIHLASFRFFERLPAGVRTIWTLHDMWPLTGYCVYSFGCDKYLSGCKGACPQWGRWGEAARTPEAEWQRRNRIINQKAKNGKLTFIAPSRWLAECAANRFSGKAGIERIPYGIPLDVYAPSAKADSRTALDLPVDRKIILTGAASLSEERKGVQHLISCMDLIEERFPDVLVVAVGRAKASGYPENWRVTGSIEDEAKLAQYYAAADVFVLPTLADNLPNTLLEAMACGTPCVACDVGGCGDIIEDGITGRLVPSGAKRELAEAVSAVLAVDTETEANMARACRKKAEDCFSLEKQAAKYTKLFSEVCHAI